MRDVIRVERLTGTVEGTTDQGRALAGAWEGPSIDADALAAIGRVVDEVLPSIVARLAVSGLGEIEVRHGDWRVRARRATPDAAHAMGLGDVHAMAPGGVRTAADDAHGDAVTAPSSERPSDVATSPAVGYFVPRPDLAVGSSVRQGDVIGWVDVLGVRQEVVAQGDGLVGKLVVGPGEPVEYGQDLVQLAPGGRLGQDAREAG